MEESEWVLCVWVAIESFGQQHMRAKEDIGAPEIAEEVGLDRDVLHVFRVGRRLDGWDDLSKLEPHAVYLAPGSKNRDRHSNQLQNSNIKQISGQENYSPEEVLALASPDQSTNRRRLNTSCQGQSSTCWGRRVAGRRRVVI